MQPVTSQCFIGILCVWEEIWKNCYSIISRRLPHKQQCEWRNSFYIRNQSTKTVVYTWHRVFNSSFSLLRFKKSFFLIIEKMPPHLKSLQPYFEQRKKQTLLMYIHVSTSSICHLLHKWETYVQIKNQIDITDNVKEYYIRNLQASEYWAIRITKKILLG